MRRIRQRLKVYNNICIYVVIPLKIFKFSSKISATGSSFQKEVLELDREQQADVNCEKHDLSNIIPINFDRLSRHFEHSCCRARHVQIILQSAI